MSSSKRTSTAPAGSKPPTSLASSLVIADNATLTGTHRITVGSNTVVHPRTKFNSTFAPITIGSTCIVSERCQIGLQSLPAPEQTDGVVIENGVIIEVGAVVEAKCIGEGSIVEINARISKGAVIGKHCKIGPYCVVAQEEVIPEFTVMFGDGSRRVDQSGVEDLKLKMVARQAEVLKKLIPSNLSKFK